MRYSFILPDWLKNMNQDLKNFEREDHQISEDEILELNEIGYNIFYFPNYKSSPKYGFLSGKDIDVFQWVFVDMDLKGTEKEPSFYSSKLDFVEALKRFPLKPTKTVDSGHGVHAYWRLSDLTRETYLELQKRLIKDLKTDPAIWDLKRLMRVPGYYNTKIRDSRVMCKLATTAEVMSDNIYTVEQLSKELNPITIEDRKSIEHHLNKHIYGIPIKPEQLQFPKDPPEFFKAFLESSKVLRDFYYNPEDRSKAEFSIANILQQNGFSEEDTRSVLVTCSKASTRSPEYVENIIRKVYDNPMDVMDSDYLGGMLDKSIVWKQKEDVIKDHEINKKYNRILLEKEEDGTKKTFTFVGTEVTILEDYKANVDRLDSSMQNRLFCITPGLTRLIPLEGEEVVLFAAQTGHGKSSIAANIVEPILSAGKKILYLSTEESAMRILVRLCALKNGWNFNDQNSWTENMRKKRDEDIIKFIKSGDLRIIDQNTRGIDKLTNKPISPLQITNLDNLKTIMESTIRDELGFDLCVLDYITKIRRDSSSNKEDWKVIIDTMGYIEEWCKKTTTPAVVFAQLKSPEEAHTTDFQTRIKRAKQLYDAVSFAVEINTDHQERTTEWKCHKNRNYGVYFRETLAFKNGRYIDMSDNKE